MLSYQHSYHAGNPADFHKHGILAGLLDYLVKKDKPLSYIETHSGRGLYDLGAEEAQKTGEAEKGVAALLSKLRMDHPFYRAQSHARDIHGSFAYAGSPLIAQFLLRDSDRLHLAELHPQEFEHLRSSLRAPNTRVVKTDGWQMAQSLCPPTPRRGVIVVDPSYERSEDYKQLPSWLSGLDRKWNVGIKIVWYPILKSMTHLPMIRALERGFPDAIFHEVRFPPVREGHRMIGSGLMVQNAPFGTDKVMAEIAALFDANM